MPDIVIIEDDAAIRKLVCYALDNDGYTAHGFDSAEAFHASDVKADLLILDIMLPDEDGISILKKIRARGDGANLPVMMLTAKGNEYDKVEALDLGADDYMTKPFGVMELWHGSRPSCGGPAAACNRPRKMPPSRLTRSGWIRPGEP